MSYPIIIEDYDPRWPEQFAALHSKLDKILGPLAARIEHVGSTAVPGLAAKPIIDLDVLLHKAADLPQVIRALATIGYEHRGDLGVPGREAFYAPQGEMAHHLYICAPDSPEFSRHIAFRDYLCAHSPDAAAYSRLKRTLAVQFADDREGYNRAKAEFIQEIVRRNQSGGG